MPKRKLTEPHAEPLIETADAPPHASGSISPLPDVPLAEAVTEELEASQRAHGQSPDPTGEQMEPAGEARKWVERANPWPSLSYHWHDYKVTLQERSWTRETDKPSAMQIKFGSGSREDQPKAFEPIKDVLKSHGYRWDNEDKAWSRWLKSGKTREGKLENARIREESLKLIAEVVGIEEGLRGAATGQPMHNQFPRI